MIEITKSKDFEQNKKDFLHRVENEESYLTTSFEEGKELFLKIKITDRYLSRILFDLLLHKENPYCVKGIENLGFELEEIILNPMEYSEKQKEEIKTKLMEEFKNSLDKNLNK